MSTLGETSVHHINAAYWKAKKRRKEELLKLNSYDEVVSLKQQQKDVRRQQLDVDGSLTAWNMAGEEDKMDRRRRIWTI